MPATPRKLVLASEPWEPRYQFCQSSSTAFTVRRVIAPVWGTSPWAAYYTPNLPFLLGVLLAGYFGEVLRDANGQPHICRTAPAWSVTPRSISRCQGVSADTDHTWGDLNTCWGAPETVRQSEPAVWGDTSYTEVSSEDVTNRERQSQSLSLTCAPRGGSAPLCGGRCASALAWPSDHVWRGAWQDAPWRQIFSMNFTS